MLLLVSSKINVTPLIPLSPSSSLSMSKDTVPASFLGMAVGESVGDGVGESVWIGPLVGNPGTGVGTTVGDGVGSGVGASDCSFSTKSFIVLSLPVTSMVSMRFNPLKSPSRSFTLTRPSGCTCSTAYTPASTLNTYFPFRSVKAIAIGFPCSSKRYTSTFAIGSSASSSSSESPSWSSVTTPEISRNPRVGEAVGAVVGNGVGDNDGLSVGPGVAPGLGC
mmetsp:Transcript_21945/g.32672  ORF Transcript_21945/g.32672 Transcript_21945/m.32672 type:complete len:221 (+) Transcript_21945:5954-6616(+)